MSTPFKTVGGVSPIKRKMRGGKAARKATSTKRGRAGYSSSEKTYKSGEFKGVGKNVHGYSEATRFGTTGASRSTTGTGGVSGGGGDDNRTWNTVNIDGTSQSKQVATTATLPGYKTRWSEMKSGNHSVYTKYMGNHESEEEAYKAWVKASKAWWATKEGKAYREKLNKSKGKTITDDSGLGLNIIMQGQGSTAKIN